MKICGIYKITNLLDGKIYVGQTINYNKRKTSHFAYLKNGKHHNKHLQNAFNVYGVDVFQIELICECESKELDALERHFIKELKSMEKSSGYNMMTGGQIYRQFSQEVKEKMSIARKGVKFSEQHKLRIGESQKGRMISIESINKMKESLKKIDRSGSKNPNALISDKTAKNIIIDLIKNMTVNEISNKHQVSKETIYNLLYNKSYPKVMPEIRENLKNRTTDNLNENIAEAITMYLNGESQNKIASELNMSRNTIRRELKLRGIDTQKCINQYVKQVNTEVIL